MKKEINIQEAIYSEDAIEYRVLTTICDKFCIESFFGNHVKSQTYFTNIRKSQQLNITNTNK